MLLRGKDSYLDNRWKTTDGVNRILLYYNSYKHFIINSLLSSLSRLAVFSFFTSFVPQGLNRIKSRSF